MEEKVDMKFVSRADLVFLSQSGLILEITFLYMQKVHNSRYLLVLSDCTLINTTKKSPPFAELLSGAEEL